MGASLTVVDDNESFRFLLGLLLKEELGVECLTLASLADATAQSPAVLGSDVVILDVNLGPNQPDGIAVYDWMRVNGYGGIVLFMTGHAVGSPYVQRAVQTGVRVVEKPASTDEIVRVVRELMFGGRAVECGS